MGRRIQLRLILRLVSTSAWILLSTLPLAAQGPGGGDLFVISGTSIPAHLEGLEEAQIDYLTAWSRGDAASLLLHLAPGAQVLTRSGVVEADAIRNLLLRVVPRTRLRGASIFLVDDADGWVSVGTLLDMDMDQGGHSRPNLGSSLVVWVHLHAGPFLGIALPRRENPLQLGVRVVLGVLLPPRLP